MSEISLKKYKITLKEVTMGKTYMSMKGKEVDMEKLSLQNELTPAVGNAKVNARGDELGPGGEIIRRREDVLGEYYAKNPRAVAGDTHRQRRAEEPVADTSNEISAPIEEIVVNEDLVENKIGRQSIKKDK